MCCRSVRLHMQHRTIGLLPISVLLFVALALGASTKANGMTCESTVNGSEGTAWEVLASERLTPSSPNLRMSLAPDFAMAETDYEALLAPVLDLGQPGQKQPAWLCSALGDEDCNVKVPGHLPTSPQPLQVRVHRLALPSCEIALCVSSATKIVGWRHLTPMIHPGFSRGIYRPPRLPSFS